MSDVPEIRYARSGKVSIAYSRWGEGDPDHLIIFTPPFVSNIELMWELPEWERMLRWAGKHHQIIMLDKRGVGLSDRVTEPSTLAENIADVLAVMETEEVKVANLVAHSEGGSIAVALAALFPERVRRMFVMNAPAFGVQRDVLENYSDADHPFPSLEQEREFGLSLVRTWGRPESVWLKFFAPSVSDDARVRRWWARFERQSSSSGSILAMFRGQAEYDLTPMFGKVQVPTMIGHAIGDRVVHIANGRSMADLIPGARLLEWDSIDHMWSFAAGWREAQNDIIEFITGTRPGAGTTKEFATVLFTDIVDSTKRAAELGDQGWRSMIDLHDTISRARIGAAGGSLVKTTGDGILAKFPDPRSAVIAAQDLARDLGASGLPIRAGMHIGQIEIRDDGDVAGLAVNIAARVQALASPSEVLVSRTMRDMLIGSDIVMDDRGEHALKGVEGSWQVFATSRP